MAKKKTTDIEVTAGGDPEVEAAKPKRGRKPGSGATLTLTPEVTQVLKGLSTLYGIGMKSLIALVAAGVANHFLEVARDVAAKLKANQDKAAEALFGGGDMGQGADQLQNEVSEYSDTHDAFGDPLNDEE